MTRSPHDRHTLDSLLRLLEADGDLAAQVLALGEAAHAAAQNGAGDQAALRVKRAELLEQLQDKPAAAAEWERVLGLEPAHSGAQAALSRLYLELGAIGDLERVQRGLLQQDPLNPRCYRALAEGWRATGRKEEELHALQALWVLRAADPGEQRAAEAEARAAPKPQRGVSEEDFAAALVHPALQGPLLQLLQAVGGLLLRQLPDDLGAHKIGWRTQRHGLEGNVFPEHGLLRQVCELLGLAELDLYWLPERKLAEPAIGHSKAPALILGPEVFAGLGEPEKAFVLGRALGPLRLPGLEVLRALPPAEAGQAVLAVAKGLDAGRRFAGEDERLPRAVAKAVARAGELHAALAPAAQALWAAREQLDWADLQRAVQLGAARCGLLAAGGVVSAAKAVAATTLTLRGRIPETTEAAVKELREVPELKDLLAFSVSEGYARLRKRQFALPATRKR